MRHNKILYYLIFIFLLIIATMPQLLTFREEFSDTFVYPTVALAEMSMHLGRIIVNPFLNDKAFWQWDVNWVSIRTAVTSLRIQLSYILGLPIIQLTFIPVIGFCRLVLSFVLARAIIKDNLYALIYTLCISYCWEFVSLNNLYYISMGIFLHMLFVFILLKQFEKSNIIYIGLLPIIFICSFLTYYSGEFYSLLFICIASFVILSFKKIGLLPDKKPLLNLAISTIVIFIVFDNVFDFFLVNFRTKTFTEQIMNYIQYILLLLNGEEYSEFKPMFSNGYAIYFDAINRLTIIGSILLYGLFYIYKYIKEKTTILYFRDVFLVTVIIMCALETIMYAMLGHLEWRYLRLFLSLGALNSLFIMGNYFNKKLLCLLASFLILFSFVGNFIFSWTDPVNVSQSGRGYKSTMNQTLIWICQNIDKGVVVSDYNVSGILIAYLARFDKAESIGSDRIFNNLNILYNNNEKEFSNDFSNKGWDYLVMSKLYATQAVYGDGWAPVGPPLGKKLLLLEKYNILDKLYDDGNGYIYLYKNMKAIKE